MYKVVKVNQRLEIVNFENGWALETAYIPPNFVREKMHSRYQLHELANELNSRGRDINIIADWEACFTNSQGLGY